MAVKGKTLQHVGRVFDVFRFANTGGKKGNFYGIVLELLTKLSESETKEFDKICDYILEESVMETFPAADLNKTMDAVKKLVEHDITHGTVVGSATSVKATAPQKKAVNTGTPEARQVYSQQEVDRICNMVEMGLKKFQFEEILKDLKSADVQFYDFHPGNLMKRGSTYVITDLGRADSRGAEPPIMEKIVETIIKEIGVTFTTSGPGGTQTGTRAGSSGWSSPQNMYTKDPAAAAATASGSLSDDPYEIKPETPKGLETTVPVKQYKSDKRQK
jgi:hypothetical protein